MKQKDSIVDFKGRLETAEQELLAAHDRIKSLEDKMLSITKTNDDRMVQGAKLGTTIREVRDIEKYLYAVRSDLKIIESRINELSDSNNEMQQRLSKSWFSRTFGS